VKVLDNVDGDRLIASGSTAQDVYFKATAEGVEVPFVELLTHREPVPSTGGWLREPSRSPSHYYNTLKPEMVSQQFFITDKNQ